ncbi:MAG: hypothetical protein PWP14_571 [Methanolobus sp.]|nr:hypothetical protein [Methanolobus sp.]MDN5309177.1 hypothetical protein [Methanolobus sp.]
MNREPVNPQKYIRFLKIGIFFTALFGMYLGVQGLYLLLVEKNFITGASLFLAGLLIAPPPIGISRMVKEQFGIDLSIPVRMVATTLLLFIAWLSL